MACPNCDQTMDSYASPGGASFFHCPRCGTLRAPWLRDAVSVPSLIQRARDFGATLGPRWGELWHQLGVAECINLPGQRGGPR